MSISAILHSAPPLRGAKVPAKGAAVRIVIPGRPQSRARNLKGNDLHQARAYHELVQQTARAAGLGHNGHPHTPNGHVAINLTFIYASEQLDLPPTAWPAERIPNAHRAPEVALNALVGLAYTHVSQADPLIVTRRVLTPATCLAEYGSSDGATIIEIDS